MRDIDETVDGFDSAERHPLELLADEFSAALRDGSQPSVTEFAERVPELREQAVALLQSIVMFEQVSQQEGSRHRSDRTANRFVRRTLETLGDFKIIREIGRGGMGIIYEAEQLSLKRRVALKVLGPGIADSAKQLERFRRESEAIARLHHTNIVPVFGIGEADGVHYFAMQLIDGKPLSTPPQLGFPEMARIGMQAASALTYAHEHGVLHRDIKPSNLLLDSNGELWVTDFGLAKLTDGGELTQDGDIMGTLKYMAPEQLDGRSDARTDVYALGLTLYELATHQPAFDTSKSLADRIRHHDIRSPRSLNAAIPRNLETIILKATARDADARYQTASELSEDLRRFTEDRPIAARRESVPERLGRWMRRNPVVAGSLALTLLVLVATSAVSGFGYWATQRALRAAEMASKTAVLARDEAEFSRARAEGNLNVALAAFDAIFDNVAQRGVPQTLALNVGQISGNTSDSEAAAAPLDTPQFESTLTVADVDLLTNLLGFYREFANQNSDDASLQSRIARAYQRSGQIQQRLGESDEAIESYDEALILLAEQLKNAPSEPFGSLAIAQILNDRGIAILTTTEFIPDVVEHHHRAAALLKSQPETIATLPDIRFEIARSLDLAGSVLARRGVTNAEINLAAIDGPPEHLGPRGSRRPPPGFGPPKLGGDRSPGRLPDRLPLHLPDRFPGDSNPPPRLPVSGRHALPSVVDELFAGLQPPPNLPFDRQRDFRPVPPSEGPRGDYPHDEGRQDSGPNHGGRPNFSDIARIVEAELNEASQLLHGLCNEFPEKVEYQLASAQVNRHRMQLFLFMQRGAAGTEAFESARTSLATLVEHDPQNPQYLLELADTLSYASAKMKSISAEEEEQYLLQAIDIGEQLCAAFPTVPEYLALLASSRDKFGAFARQHGRWLDAQQNFTASADGMEALHKRFPENRFYQLASVLAVNNLAMLHLDPQSGLAVLENWLASRDRLQAAIGSLTRDNPIRDPLSDRLLIEARATLAQLQKRTTRP